MSPRPQSPSESNSAQACCYKTSFHLLDSEQTKFMSFAGMLDASIATDEIFESKARSRPSTSTWLMRQIVIPSASKISRCCGPNGWHLA